MERKYYLKWEPRGFVNEVEYFRTTGKKARDKLLTALIEYEEINNGRCTTDKASFSEVKNETPIDGDAILKAIDENETEDVYGYDKVSYFARRLASFVADN